MARVTDLPDAVAPSIEAIERLADAAYRRIPLRLRQHVRDVVIRVEEFPDDETLDEMGIESPFDLMGLYRGVGLARRPGADLAPSLDMIFLYRRPLLDYWCETGEELGHLVRHVLIHEIGHHFGLSDADMAALEEEADD
jgi:predicted Zn-dependent protease with MMP-like domain